MEEEKKSKRKFGTLTGIITFLILFYLGLVVLLAPMALVKFCARYLFMG